MYTSPKSQRFLFIWPSIRKWKIYEEAFHIAIVAINRTPLQISRIYVATAPKRNFLNSRFIYEFVALFMMMLRFLALRNLNFFFFENSSIRSLHSFLIKANGKCFEYSVKNSKTVPEISKAPPENQCTSCYNSTFYDYRDPPHVYIWPTQRATCTCNSEKILFNMFLPLLQQFFHDFLSYSKCCRSVRDMNPTGVVNYIYNSFRKRHKHRSWILLFSRILLPSSFCLIYFSSFQD